MFLPRAGNRVGACATLLAEAIPEWKNLSHFDVGGKAWERGGGRGSPTAARLPVAVVALRGVPL